MKFRRLAPEDARYCIELRKRAFTDLFQDQLQPDEIAAAANAYQPDDFIVMAAKGPFYIVEEMGYRAGFFYLRRRGSATAELCLIYIDPRFHRRGIGRGCIRYMDKWVSSHWKEVDTLTVDTVIPGYNADFYQKAEYTPLKQTFCKLAGMRVKALRLSKRLKE